MVKRMYDPNYKYIMITMKKRQQKRNQYLLVIAFQFVFSISPAFAATDTKEPEAAVNNPAVGGVTERFNPVFEIELGGESFYAFDLAEKQGIAGLSAIMVDIDGHISNRLRLFAAFHFDSSVWYDFLNMPLVNRQHDGSEYDLELEVEEFFLTYHTPLMNMEISVGRMFSVISYANQLHLADFQFNIKPRIFTEYWGNNHGLAMDGGSVKWTGNVGPLQPSLVAEVAKNRYESEALVFTTVLDLSWSRNMLYLGLRGFGYFDHDNPNHPMLHWLPANAGQLLQDKNQMGLNGLGVGFNALYNLGSERNVFFQSEWVNRSLSGQNYRGGYAFILWPLGDDFEGSFMVQQLERPLITDQNFVSVDEKAYTFGLSWFPLINHRLRLEYSVFDNSHFYNNMLTAKWTFYVNLL